MGVNADSQTGRAEGWTRLVPILGWSRRVRPPLAARRRHRGHRGHRDDRAQEPRLRGHRRHPGGERAVRGRRGRDHLRAVLHVAAHLDRAQLVARGRGRRRGPADRRRRRPRRRSWWPRSRSRPGPCSCCVGAPADGLDRPLPVEGGRDRLPRRRRHRRRHRRAAQAHRDLRGWHQRVAGARVVGPRPGRHPTGRRCSSAASPSPSSSGFGSRCRGSRARSCSWSAASSASVLFDLGEHGVALVGPVPRGLPLPQLPSLELVAAAPPGDRHLGHRAAAHRVLADGRAMRGRSRRAIGIAST